MYFQLAWRNIWRNPRRTAVILTAIFIGVASMIFLGALMRGMMQGMVKNAIDDLTGHIRIQHARYRSDPAIDHRLPDPEGLLAKVRPLLPEGSRGSVRIRVDAVAATARENTGVVLVGLDPRQERGCSFIMDAPLEGRFFEADEKNALVIGRALADQLGTGVGRKLVLMSQGADGEIASKAFRIRGLYRAKMQATEKTVVFAPLTATQRMLVIGPAATEIAVVLPGTHMAHTDLTPLTDAMAKRIGADGAGPSVLHWREMLPMIDAYLGLFDGFMLVWYLVVFVAMGFGIVNTVLMAVYERMREFGLLSALGMRPARIFRMILGETLVLLVFGMALGNAAALALTAIFGATGIDLAAFATGIEMWGIERVIRPVLSGQDVLLANATVLVLGMVVGVYPALRAARFTPVETMRHV